MKTLILGAHGTLGQALTARLPALGFQVEAALGRDGCDLTDPDTVGRVVSQIRPDVIFNAAAYTNVDRAEDEGDRAFAANAIGPETLARAAAQVGAKLVHYSTDFIFDGEQERPYDEFDPPAPLGVYGRSKLAGEKLVTAAWTCSFILRVGCLYGQGGRNFPSTIADRLRRGETVRADATRVASPTWVVPVVQVSAALAATEHFGTYHCTSNGETTWADYAKRVAERLGVPIERVQALPYDALSLKAARPRRAILDNRMLRLRGLDTLGTWDEQVEAFLSSQPVV